MRRLTWFAALGIASCAVPQPTVLAPLNPPPAGTFTLDQGWSDADRAVFDQTAQGSRLIDASWFLALRRADSDQPFVSDQLERFGYIPSAPPGTVGALPIGFVKDGSQLGITCAACHTGQIRVANTTWRIDGGRANADFQAFLTDLGATVRTTLSDPHRWAAFVGEVLGPNTTAQQTSLLRRAVTDWSSSFDAFMAASLPGQPWGAGRLDAFGMIFNRVTGLDLKDTQNLRPADAPVRYPFIWDAPRQDRTQWTGAAPNGTYLRGMARNTGEVYGVFGQLNPHRVGLLPPRYDNSVDLTGLQRLEEKVVALKPPPWPKAALGFDQARADLGAKIFAAQCASCHEARPSTSVRNAWNTVVADVGTDPRTFLNAQAKADPRLLTGTQQPPFIGERLADPSPKLSILANVVVGSLLQAAVDQDPAIPRAIQQDFVQQRLPLLTPATTIPAAAVVNATRALYKAAPPVSGAAYEARVLTGIWAVAPYLHNGSVPTLYDLLLPTIQRPKRFHVGRTEFDREKVGVLVDVEKRTGDFVVDPATGNGNGGHEYGTTLKDPERMALIEYLKAL